MSEPKLTRLRLSRLKFGDEAPQGSINVRKSKSDVGFADLKESIRLAGVSIPLIAGTQGTDIAYVAAGNRRLRALRELEKEDLLPSADVMVVLHEDKTPAELLALSLIENAPGLRLQLHPVDVFEAYAELAKNMQPDAIARAYGVAEKEIEGALALGRLSPAVRKAWREGKIKKDEAQLFTLAGSHDRQNKIFKKLDGKNALYDHAIRTELKVDESEEASAHVTFVGVEDYEQAGGKLEKNLFGGIHIVHDAKLAAKLAIERLKERCEYMVGQGWGWATTEGDMPAGWNNWRKIESKPRWTAEERKAHSELSDKLGVVEERDWNQENDEEGDKLRDAMDVLEESARLRGFTPEQKAKTGCVLKIGEEGKLEVTYGVIRPADKKASAQEPTRRADDDSGGPAKPRKASGAISNALATRLSEQLTHAAGAALAQDPTLGVYAMAAAFFSADAPLAVSENGMETSQSGHGLKPEGKYADLLASYRKNGLMTAVAKLALVAGRSLDLGSMSAARMPLDDKATVALCAAIDPKALRTAIARNFDAKAYFHAIPSSMIVRAIREAVNEDEARKAAKKPKGELVKFALANVVRTGWLPPELRTAHYTGPREKPKVAKKKTAKKAAKPKAKPKAKGKKKGRDK